MNIAFVYLNNDRCISQGAGMIAATILSEGHQLEFFDTAYISLDTTISSIRAGNYDLLAISSSTLFYKDAMRLARSVDLTVIFGGIHATIVREAILEECGAIDYICVGEGEEFIVDFLQNLNSKTLHTIDNLGYRDGGSIHINPVRPPTNLDKLPPFPYNLFNSESIVQSSPLPGFCYVYATRGCPFHCSYCNNSSYLDLYKQKFLRIRNIDDIINELQYLKNNYPVEFFYFGDEMILFDTNFTIELFYRLKKEIQLPYGCMVRVECIKPEIVKLFRETGCRYVGMGIECGDEKFRKEFLNRHMSNKQIIEAFKNLRTIDNMMLTSFNMTGYPVSYDAELTKSTNTLNNIIQPDITQTSIFYPFPGTTLYKYCVKNDLIDPDKAANNVFSESILRGR